MKNNFDQNSKGLNIEAHVSYDNGMAYYHYKESMQSLGNSRRDISDQWFIECGNFPAIDDIEFKFTDNNKTLKAWILSNVDEHTLRHFKKPYACKRDELIEILKEHFYDDEPNILNFQGDDFNGLKIGAFYKNKQIDIDYLVSTGYSQGDSCKVYFSRDLMRETWGVVSSNNELKKTFDNILWDSPITGRVIINDIEYEYELDEYDFEREEWIDQIMRDCDFNDKELLRSELESLIPESPEYN